MAFQDKKFLDAEGITHLVKLLDEYPNNQVLGSVIDAIEGELEQKAEKSEIPEVPVQDVQVNGTSILSNGVANIPKATNSTFGVIKIRDQQLSMTPDGTLQTRHSSENDIKQGITGWTANTTGSQHIAVFYGLAKAAGADMKDIANTTVGIYPDAQKTAIKEMLGVQDGLKVVRLI